MASPAPCCLQALRDATTHWPARLRTFDGIMGDAAHQKRKSDHNDGNAFDLTHDPPHGVDCQLLSRQVINDRRVTYVIWNGQIYNRSLAAQGWRTYTGPNPHNHHMHVSIEAVSRADLSNWPWSVTTTYVPISPKPYPGRPLHQGTYGNDVRILQGRLNERGKAVTVDGIFGHQTIVVVRQFQQEKHLLPDGIVGPRTWSALWQP